MHHAWGRAQGHAGEDDASSSDPFASGTSATRELPSWAQLHACAACKRAKTACNNQRPCGRCTRLGVPCSGDAKAVKHACAACKRSKIRCDIDECHPHPCSRCARLGRECTPLVPSKSAPASFKKPKLTHVDQPTCGDADDTGADHLLFGDAIMPSLMAHAV